MAHPEQQDFIKRLLKDHPSISPKSAHVLEIGSQNISGSVREFFGSCQSYIGVDLGKAPGVDLVVPGELFQLSTGWADVSISTECFEHAFNWKDILLNMIRITKEDGLIIVTCAGFGRPTHGTIDTNTYSSPFTSSYYKNVVPQELEAAVASGKFFKRYGFEANCEVHDSYFWGIRNSCIDDAEIMSTEEALARARGQISMISIELAHANYKLMSKNESLSRKLARKCINQYKKLAYLFLPQRT